MNAQTMSAAEKKLSAAFKSDFSHNAPKGLVKMQITAVVSALPIFAYVLVLLFVLFYFFKAVLGQFMSVLNAGVLIYLIAYVGAVLIFGVLIFLFARPLFKAKAKNTCAIIGKDREPNLYAFVDSIAKRLSLDSIIKIRISPEVVVDAEFESIKDFKEKQLTLTLGLPLLATLKMHELASMIAHEFSRYADPKISKIYFAERWLLHRLYDLTHKDDSIVVTIDKITEKFTFLIPVFIPIRLVLQFVNGICSSVQGMVESISKEMLYDIAFYADDFQAQVIGSRQFDPLLKRLVRVDQAYHFTCEKMLSGENKPRNMADLIVALYDKNPLPENQFIEMALSEAFTSWHMMPTPSSRTRRMLEKEIDPIYSLQADVKKLISGMNALGEQLTVEFYEANAIDSKSFDQSKTSVKPTTGGRIPLLAEEKILKVYASGLFRRELVWSVPLDNKLEALPEERLIPFLNKVVLGIRQSLPEFNKCFDLTEEYQRHVLSLHFYQWLVKDGSKNRPSVESMDSAKLYVKEFDVKFGKTFDAYCKSYGVRVAAAVELGKGAKAYKSAKSLLKILSGLAQIQEQIRDAKVKTTTLEKLLKRREDGELEHKQTIARFSRMIFKVVQAMDSAMSKVPANMLAEEFRFDIGQNRLREELLNGKDFEFKVAERFNELLPYFEAYNLVISAKLAQFVGLVERKRDIEPVAKITLS